MSPDTLPDLSPELAYALRIAARELARYCEEFALWRKTTRGSLAVQCLPRREMLLPHLMQDVHPPDANATAGR